jgi:hypothetical protein
MRYSVKRAESRAAVTALGILAAFGLIAGCGGSSNDNNPDINNPYWGYYTGSTSLGANVTAVVNMVVQPSSNQSSAVLTITGPGETTSTSFNGSVNRNTGILDFNESEITIPGSPLVYDVDLTGQVNTGGTGTFNLRFSNPNAGVSNASGNFARDASSTTTTTNTNTTSTTTTGLDCTGAQFNVTSVATAGTNANLGQDQLNKGNGFLGTTSQNNYAVAGAATTCPVRINAVNRSITFSVVNRTAFAAPRTFPIGLDGDSNSLVTYTETVFNSNGGIVSRRSWRSQEGIGSLTVESIVGNTHTFRLTDVRMVPSASGTIGEPPTGAFQMSATGQVTQNTPPPG